MVGKRLSWALSSALLLLGCAVLPVWPGEEARVDFGPRYFTPSREVVTPHIPWAKPYAGGPLRTLIIAPRMTMREVVELAQRLGLDYTTCFTNSRDALGRGEEASGWQQIRGSFQPEVATELADKLASKYDLVVLGSIRWDILPKSARYRILSQVNEAGMGLVLANVSGGDEELPKLRKRVTEDGTDYLPGSWPTVATPGWQGKGSKDLFLPCALGKGRVLFMEGGSSYRQFLCPPRTDVEEPRVDYDYYFAVSIRGLLWAARREPAVAVMGWPERLERARWPAALDLTVANRGAVLPVTWSLVVRERTSEVAATAHGNLALQQGRNPLRIKLPLLPAAVYIADLWVRDRRSAVLGWGSGAIGVAARVSLGRVDLSKVSLSQREPVVGKVPLTSPASANFRLRVEQTDVLDRIVARSVTPVRAGAREVAFSMPVQPQPLSILQRLRVDLCDSRGNVVATQRLTTSLDDLERDLAEPFVASWFHSGTDFADRAFLQTMRHIGFDASYFISPEACRIAAEEGLRFVQDSGHHFTCQRDSQDPYVRKPCLLDPTCRKTIEEGLARVTAPMARYGVREVMPGGESFFAQDGWDFCFCPFCLADFRRWTQDTYGDLSVLNAEYGTTYGSWKEVKPVTYEEAKRTGNFAPWVDHRLHMETVWAGAYAMRKQAVHRSLPRARVGCDSTDTGWLSSYADDYDQLMQVFDMNNVYRTPWTYQMLRDFGRPGMLRASWYGGYLSDRNQTWQHFYTWEHALEGQNGWFLYNAAAYPEDNVLELDAGPCDFFKATVSDLRELKSGIGRLLNQSVLQHDGIALLYSPASEHLCTLTAPFGGSAGGHQAAQYALGSAIDLTKDLGLQLRLLPDRLLAAGELNRGAYRALVLPLSLGISPAGAAEIRKFVQAGGTVVADAWPGSYDGHGKPTDRALDDLFGARTGPVVVGARGNLELTEEGRTQLSSLGRLPATAVQADPALQVTTGRSLARVGQAPVLVVRRVGKGQTVYLNFPLADYFGLVGPGRPWANGEGHRQLFRALLARAGIRARVTITPSLPRCRVSRFRQGTAEYVGILQEPSEPGIRYSKGEVPAAKAAPVQIQFGRTAHVYDVRAHRYLGEVTRVTTTMEPGQAKLYALLPAEVNGVKVTVRSERRWLRCRARVGGGAAVGVVRFSLVTPDSRSLTHYARNVDLRGGAAEADFALALSDPPGRWQVMATDVVSGNRGHGSTVFRGTN